MAVSASGLISEVARSGRLSRLTFGFQIDLALRSRVSERTERNMANGQIMHDWQTAANGGWIGATALGGPARYITCTRNADGRLEVFYVGMNNELFHNWQVTAGGAWKGETRFAEDSALQIAVTQN